MHNQQNLIDVVVGAMIHRPVRMCKHRKVFRYHNPINRTIFNRYLSSTNRALGQRPYRFVQINPL